MSNDSFRKRYRSLQQGNGETPIGFICGNKTDNYAAEHGFCVANKFMYTSENYAEKEELESFNYLNTFGYVVAASKGLLLLEQRLVGIKLYDLVSKKHVKLPGNNLKGRDCVSLGFKCEERKTNYHRPHLCYKVVCVKIPNKGRYRKLVSSYKVNTFSSETGTWQKSITKSRYPFFMQSHSVSKVIGGAFHWHQLYMDWIVAYDSDNPNGRVVLIESPFTDDDDTLYGKLMRQLDGTKDGSLQFINIKDMVLNVWIMRSISGRSYMNEEFIRKRNWRLASSVSLWDIGVGSIHDLQQKSSRIICADPVDPHIIYLGIG